LPSPLVFQRAVAIRPKFTRRGSPVGFITFDPLGEHKEFDTVVADLTEMLEDRVAGASRSRWRQNVRYQGCFLDVRNYVGPAAFAPRGTVFGSLSLRMKWFSDTGINALQDHTPSRFIHPLPVPLLVQGGRLSSRSSVSPQVAGACKIAATALARREKARALGARKARVGGTQIAVVLRFRLVC
jgi:hypothetical protein